MITVGGGGERGTGPARGCGPARPRRCDVGRCGDQLAVQVTVGTAELLPEPMNPNVVLAPEPSCPFQATLLADTDDPLVVRVALQDWLMLCPEPRVQLTVQPLMAELPAVTVTLPWNPLFHEDTTE